MDSFSSFRLGSLDLPNRIVMAPMTRSRAVDNLPNALMRDYYTQRASAGLIITEGIAPSPNGLGYARIPGLYSDAQVQGFRAVTDGVHAAGGRIFAQLMHVGRIAHVANVPAGGRVVAPSAITAAGTIWTDAQGVQPHSEPAALSADELATTRAEFVQAARNAVAAGFDGIEFHGANGYLLEQFLHPHTNRRADGYGGGVTERARFVVEVVQAAAEAIGAERVGLRISPYGTYNDMPARTDDIEAQYRELARAVRGIAYLHVVGSADARAEPTRRALRAVFEGPMITNGGFDRARADALIGAGEVELVSFGRPFIANPDLVQRYASGRALSESDPATYYTPGAAGYTDYAPLA